MATTGQHLLPGPAAVGMDDESYDLVLKLMLDDARQLGSRSNTKGKQRMGTASDTDLAFRLYAEELEAAATLARDRRLSQSLQRAVRSDAGAISQLQHEERMARHDRQVCIALSEGRDPPPRPPSPPEDGMGQMRTTNGKDKGKGKSKDVCRAEQSIPAVSFDLEVHKRARLAGHDLSVDDEADDHLIFLGKEIKQGESSSWAASRRPPRDQSHSELRTCTSCMDQVSASRLIRAPCQHEYCQDCLGSLFHHAVRDESLFPPQCCRQPIPVDDHKHILGAKLVFRYHERAVEFSTQNRTYCHNTQCAAFIVPGCIENDVGLCIHCGALTCVHCKGATHTGDCPLDRDLQRVLQIAHQEGWRRCYRCSAMVELNMGCYHMT